MGRFDYYDAAYNGSYDYLYHEHHQRTHTIYKRITWNHARPFSGIALPRTSGEGLDDIQDFRRAGRIRPGPVLVYWTDGAYRYETEDQCGMLASAVTYLSGTSWKTKTSSLLRYSGHTDDAELYALKMAFDLAVRHVIDDGLKIANVVFFTDSKYMRQMLAGMQDTRRSIGPIPTEGEWVLEHVNEAADKLSRHGTKAVVA
jgi:ribonuclease HI